MAGPASQAGNNAQPAASSPDPGLEQAADGAVLPPCHNWPADESGCLEVLRLLCPHFASV